MELADNPKLEVCEGKLDSGKITETKGFQYTTKPESFVIDIDKNHSNSRIIRNFSRKGLIRGSNNISHDNAADPGDSISSPSPLASSSVVGGLSTLEKQEVIGLGSRDQMGGSNGSSGGIIQSHQIAMTTGHAVERSSSRRNSFKRSPQGSWYLHPRKIFLFCATLSFVGTIFLTYYAYSYGRMVRLEGNDQFDY